MLVVHPSLPVNNLKEFIEYSKAQPAGLDYASSGPGTSTHLAAEMFNAMTGAKLVHVPFKGNAEVLNALLGGHVKSHFALTASTLQHVRSGALRVIAVTTEKRLPDLPDVPTIAELGYPGYEISSWQGVFAPAGTPKEIVGRLNGEIVAMLKTPEVQARITREGAIPIGSSPEQWSRRASRTKSRSGRGWPRAPASRPRNRRAPAHPGQGRTDAQIFATARCCAVCWPRCRKPAQDAAKDYPNRAIHIVVPFPAGGPADVAARLLAQRMNEDWGQPVIVDNRPGGNTVIGAQPVAKAAPDGYTLLMAINSTLVMNQFLYKSLPYDPINDFAPITTTTKTVSVLAVGAETVRSPCKELIAKAKAAPGKLNYGAGTITAQLMGHRFHKAAGLDIVYVPFKGTPETVNGLLTGSVEIIYAANVTVNPLIESGKVRALAKLDRRAPASMANIPTLAEAAGLPDLEDMSVWLGLVAPKGTPPADHRQAAAEGRADPGRSGDAGEIRAHRRVSDDQHAGGVRPLHPPGSRPLVEGAEGNRHQIRLTPDSAQSDRPTDLGSAIGTTFCGAQYLPSASKEDYSKNGRLAAQY